MGNTFARLFPFTRRGTRDGSSRGDDATDRQALADEDQVADDDAPLAAVRAELDAPPVLRPAAIFRQLLYDPAEVTPVWARPRPAPEPTGALRTIVEEPAEASATADEPTPAKRRRRPKSDTAAAPARPRKRAARKDSGAADR